MKSQLREASIDCLKETDLVRLEAEMQGCLLDYVSDFRMSVRDGGFWLYGRATTFYGKQLAQQGVMKRSQIPIRANRIDVV